ncbi:MAG: mercuric transporter MerT family protein [Phycisphaerales bacterium]
MKIQVLYFQGCPNHMLTVDLARQVVAEIGLDAEIKEVEVTRDDDAAQVGFLGSPTVLVNGVDIEAGARTRTGFGFSCRTYAGRGVPPRALMVAAVESAAAEQGRGVAPVRCETDDGGAATTASRVAELLEPEDRSGLWAIGGSVGSAALASACCWLPLALLAVGTSAGGVSTAFERTRPLFLVLAAVFLSTGFYLNYFRKPTAVACSTCAAPRPKLRRFNRAMLWVSTVVVLSVAVFPNWFPLLLNRGATAATASQSLVDAPTVELRIDGMTCEGCAAFIEHTLVKLPGVRSASVVYTDRRALVALDPDSGLSNEALISAIEKLGYQASLESPSTPAIQTTSSQKER